MKLSALGRATVVVMIVLLALQIVAPVGNGQQLKTCKQAFDDCCRVAAIVGSLYYLYCLQGYAFCKKYIEKS